MVLTRLQKFTGLNQQASCFLWGPRQVGKSTLLKQSFPDSLRFNLLDPATFEQLQRDPSLLSQKLLAQPRRPDPVIIDEVQKIPQLLDAIQLLMDDHGVSFILCGSSARKLKRGGANLLGGRALRYELHPLVYREIPDFDLIRALNHGLLPRHYLSDDPRDYLHAYVGDYLKEEILAEGLTRNVQAFSRFLDMAAFSHGEILNYTTIASECGVRSSTIKEYFQILEDTLLGNFVHSFRLRPKRRVIQAPKFYFFDVGIVNFLLKRPRIEEGNELFGRAFEHFIYQELVAYHHYSRKHFQISYWRTASQIEVDFILGQHEVALEVKGSKEVKSNHLKGLKAFHDEYTTKQAIVVSLDTAPRLVEGGIQVLPWEIFLERLWGGEII